MFRLQDFVFPFNMTTLQNSNDNSGIKLKGKNEK